MGLLMAEICVRRPSSGFTSKNSVAIEILVISATMRPPPIVKALMSWSPEVSTSTSAAGCSAVAEGTCTRQIWCVASIGAMNHSRSLPSQTTFMAL